MKPFMDFRQGLRSICTRVGEVRVQVFGSRSLPAAILGWVAVAAAALLAYPVALAYPPAPYHTIYGVVRDEMGKPLVVTNAEVILETLAGVQVKASIVPNLAPGMNYRSLVPMDAGLTADAYKPNALRPTVPFHLKVQIGRVTYLPIEMVANYANLGNPAESTRLDLTLGEDADGDGLPDSWERNLIRALGGNLTLQDIRPEDDADHDGLSNLREYLAGTYAFDPADGFRLDIAGQANGHPVLEFLAIRGHSYVLQASTDLQNWLPVQFRLQTDGDDAPGRDSYQATDVRLLRIEVLPPAGLSTEHLLFRAQVQ